MKYNTHKIYLKTLTPVHIGNGEEYEPVSYVIKNGEIYLIDQDKYNAFLEKNGKFVDFVKVCNTGDILKIRAFIYDNFSKNTAYKTIKVSKEFENLYQANIKSHSKNQHKILNQLAIAQTFKSLFGQEPIIPGSAVKGAIRTALLDFLAKIKEKNLQASQKKYDRFLQAYLLNFRANEVNADPLKFIKISDFNLVKGDTIVDKVKNIQNFGNDREKVPQYLELIEPNSIFEGTISIEENLNLRTFGLNENSKISLQTLLDLCKQHYLDDVFEKEKQWFTLNRSNIPGFNSNYVLKLGMHTGAYALTISKYRDITLRFGPREIRRHQEHQTTVWKSNEYNMPLGWIELSRQIDELQTGVSNKQIQYAVESKELKPASEKSKKKLFEKFGKR